MRNRCGHHCPLSTIPASSLSSGHLSDMENLNPPPNKILCRFKVGKHSWLWQSSPLANFTIAHFTEKKTDPSKREKTQMTKEIKGDTTTSRGL